MYVCVHVRNFNLVCHNLSVCLSVCLHLCLCVCVQTVTADVEKVTADDVEWTLVLDKKKKKAEKLQQTFTHTHTRIDQEDTQEDDNE